MNTKNIKKHLNAKLNHWMESITDEEVKKVIKENAIITGGAMVSLLTGEPVNDYDVYFRTFEACQKVAQYYVDQWNDTHPEGRRTELRIEDNRIKVFIPSLGVFEEKSNDNPFPPIDEEIDMTDRVVEQEEAQADEKPKYRPVFMTSNAITLSDKIQVVIRFYGEVEDIHKNYDFAHCTCSWTSWDNEVQLPTKALECIINKELYYIGSKYPLCSIIRTRKYLERGYHIDAGQYVKMAFQLNELNLNDIKTLEDQLTGVDSGFFAMMIDAIHNKQEKDNSEHIDTAYVIELINRMF